MYRPNQCNRCGLILEVNCKCTSAEMVKYGEDQMQEFENKQSRVNWTDAQMVSYLKTQGYKIEKRRPSPKKQKLKRR